MLRNRSWKVHLLLGLAFLALCVVSVLIGGSTLKWIGLGALGAGIAGLDGARQIRGREVDARRLSEHRERMTRLTS